MTFEEFQAEIEQMLAVQCSLQESQLRQQEQLDRTAEQQAINNVSINEMQRAIVQIVDRTNQNTSDLTTTMLALERLVPVVERIATTTEDLVQLSAQVMTRLDTMQSEIRGLQTENHRILDILQRQEPPN